VAIKTRDLIIGVAVVVAVAGYGVYSLFVQSEQPEPTISTAVGPTAAAASTGSELLAPGPLGEKALGDPNAPNIVIEYVSMTCPHCQAFHEQVFGQVKEKYIDTGKVYFILREFPLDPLATSAIMLARCAPADSFFPVVDLLFDAQRSWAFSDDPVNALRDTVKQAGFTQDSFKECLTNQQILDGVNWVKNRGADKFGVNSTPTFFINGQKYAGGLALDEFEKLLKP
jgi:protein-disulfide isomerase